MNHQTPLQMKIKARLDELAPRLGGYSFDLLGIPVNELEFMFSLLLLTYFFESNDLKFRLKALEIAGTMAAVLDDEDSPNSLANLVVQEMRKYGSHFTPIFTNSTNN